jgi:hypothetical protein
MNAGTPAAPPKKGDLFTSIGGFFSDAWNKAINPAIGFVWHMVGGAVIGAATPSLTNMATQALAGQPVDVHAALASTGSTLVAMAVGSLVGLAQHSNNQAVKNLAGQITPDIQAQIDKKVSDAITNAVASKKGTP